MFAGRGFTGWLVDWAATVQTTVEIVRKSAVQRGFGRKSEAVVVERSLAC